MISSILVDPPALAPEVGTRTMIDFKELPVDGVRFEQLIREIFLRSDFTVHWTGVGTDGGRDLVVTESAKGPLAPFERKWLVSCKHKAHGNASVSIADVQDIPGACAAVGATGFLLATSTQPSSTVVNRLSETQSQKGLECLFWDAIEIEKRLDSPSTFPLLSLFFPESAKARPWRIYNTLRPSVWAANYKGYFLYLASRISHQFPKLEDVEAIVKRLESVPLPGQDFAWHYLRPRAVYFDDKHEQYSVFVDYLYPKATSAKTKMKRAALNAVLKDGDGLYSDGHGMWKLTHWDVRYVETHQPSDHFHIDHKNYYEPYMDKFRTGFARREFLSDELELDNIFGNTD